MHAVHAGILRRDSVPTKNASSASVTEQNCISAPVGMKLSRGERNFRSLYSQNRIGDESRIRFL
jgi:hypothetical protein